jgi:hypothetical protein
VYSVANAVIEASAESESTANNFFNGRSSRASLARVEQASLAAF